MIILAIDPGLTGALAVISTLQPNHVAVYDMPVVDGGINHGQLHNMIKTWTPDIAYIERVSAMPRDGVVSAFKFGCSFTSACVVVNLLNISTRLVTPASWKKAMKVAGGPAGKEECRKMAIDMFPANREHFARIKDHNRAEAALLAVYGLRQERLVA